MDITLTTPAVLFPAISLLLLAYTNRFLAIARIVRDIASSLHSQEDANLRAQVKNLHLRINLIKSMQAFAVSSMLLCMVSILALYSGNSFLGAATFGIAIALMIISLAISLWETLLSGNALKLELARCLDRSEQ